MRPRHVAVPFLLGCVAIACARREAPEAASPTTPTGEAQTATQAQQPGYGMPPPAPTAQPEPEAPSSTSAPAGDEGGQGRDDRFASIAEAEAALEKARAELNPSPPPARPADKDATGKPTPTKKPSASGGAPAGELAAGADRCLNACKAFASLKRAAGAVCRLAGESNERCKRAQGIVQESEARVSVCKCVKNGE